MADTNLCWLAVFFFAVVLAMLDASTSSPTLSSPGDCQRQLEHRLAGQQDVGADDPGAIRRCRGMLPPKAGAEPEEAGHYAARMQAAIWAAENARVEQAKLEAIAAAARKSHRLAGNAVCGTQIWPYLSWRCFARQVDGQSLPPPRTVTVERREGDSTSLLVRLPAEQVSARR